MNAPKLKPVKRDKQ